MKELFSAIVRDFATDVQIVTDDAIIETRAFLQPARNSTLPGKKGHQLGLAEQGLTVYIGPAGIDIAGATVNTRFGRWRVRRSEQIVVSDEGIYVWGLLSKEGERDDDEPAGHSER